MYRQNLRGAAPRSRPDRKKGKRKSKAGQPQKTRERHEQKMREKQQIEKFDNELAKKDVEMTDVSKTQLGKRFQDWSRGQDARNAEAGVKMRKIINSLYDMKVIGQERKNNLMALKNDPNLQYGIQHYWAETNRAQRSADLKEFIDNPLKRTQDQIESMYSTAKKFKATVPLLPQGQHQALEDGGVSTNPRLGDTAQWGDEGRRYIMPEIEEVD